jgi:3-dehydroquinate dehydratase type I
MICIPIIAGSTDSAIIKMAKAHALADVIEIRLDLMEEFDLKEIIRSATRPVLVTHRSRKEGGNGAFSYETRVHCLTEAITEGADYVDVEFNLPLEYRQAIVERKGTCRVIVSAHLLNRTPSSTALKALFKKMADTGGDIVKIVTWARTWKDNFRVLELIPLAQSRGIEIIAFCMGPLGRISRILSPLMGGYLTFAALETGEESAPGQISAPNMRKIWNILSP